MNNSYKTYEEYEEEKQTSNEANENLDESLYNDGADKKPKMVIIIGGIIFLIIIILIFFFACSKLNKKSDNNYLNSIRVTNGELSPKYNRETLNYSVETEQDIVTISCDSESSKATTSGCNKRIYLTDSCIEHVIKVISESKNERKYILNICKVNKNSPIIKSVDINPKGYTKDSVEVTIKATSETPLHKQAYSIDNGLSWKSSNKFKIKENKTLYIKVRDVNNTESVVTIKEITNIDKSKVSVEIKGSVSSGVSTTANVELTAFVTPETSVSGYKYQWYKGNTKISKATKSVYTATSSGEYKVVVTTGSGLSVTSNKYKVNKKSSGNLNYTLSISSVSGNPTKWTNKDVTLTIKAISSKGLHSTAYSFDGGKTYQKSSSKTFSKNQTVNIVVRDKANNKTTYNAYITKIDKTTPTVSIIGTKYVGDKLTAKVTPASTSSGYKYQWYKDNKAIDNATSASYVPTKTGRYQVRITTGAGNKKNSSEITVSNRIVPTIAIQGNITSGTWTKNNVVLTATVKNGTPTKYEWYKNNSSYPSCTTEKCTISTKGAATYKVRAVTKEGTTGFSNAFTVKIDKSAPSLTITATLEKYGGTKYVAGTETNKNVYIEATGLDIDSQIKDILFQYKSSDITQNKWYSHATSAWDSKAISGTIVIAKVDFTATGTYPFRVKVIDKAGNEKIVEHKIVINKTAKTNSTVSLTGSTSSGTWTNKDVVLTANLNTGTATKYEWYKDGKAYSSCTTKTCTIKTEGQSKYTVKAITSSGTTDLSNEYQVKIDKTKPSKPTITLSSTSQTSNNVTFTIKNGSDSNSGISKTEYRIDSSSWKQYSAKTTLLNTTGVSTVFARTIDKAGNESEHSYAIGQCNKDQVNISTGSLNSTNFTLKFSLKNSGLTGITANNYEYIYYNVTKTTDTTNKQSSSVSTYCGNKPPLEMADYNGKLYNTTTSKTKALYLNYQYQYYCIAVRPYRDDKKYESLNRWTIARKHVGGTAKPSSFNGLNTGNTYVIK